LEVKVPQLLNVSDEDKIVALENGGIRNGSEAQSVP